MTISYFDHVNKTSKPSGSISIEQALTQIKNPEYKNLITLARQADKHAPNDISGATIYIDVDEFAFLLKKGDIVAKINKYFDDNASADFVYFSMKMDQENLTSYLNKFQLKYSTCISITDFYSFFEQKKEATLFLNIIWCKYDSIKQEKTNMIGAHEIVFQNIYNFIKTTKIPVVTWNALFSEKRTLKTVDSLSGYVYMDIDDFSSMPKETVYRILTDKGLSFIKAVWYSFGGSGLGFLVQVDGLTTENFKYNWMNISNRFKNDFNIKVDRVTKDMTRINVLSFDENLFIRENVVPLVAVESDPTEEVTVKVELPTEIQSDVVDQTIYTLYHDTAYYNKSENRYTYNFYQVLFSKLNHLGIPLDNAFAFMKTKGKIYPELLSNPKYPDRDIYAIGKRQYDAYGNQFGTIKISKNQYTDENYIVLSMYKQYEGDVQLKLKEIYKKAVNKEQTVDGLIVYFSLLSKRAGILFNDTVAFLNSKLDYNVENTIKVKNIYGNAKYPFGLVVKLKEEQAVIRREKYIADYIAKGYSVIDYTAVQKNESELLQQIYKSKISTAKFSDNNADFICENYFKECFSHALPLLKATNYLNSNSNFHSIERYSKFFGESVYEKYAPYFGLKCVKQEEAKKKISFTNTLKNNEKLSDLNLTIEDNTILWADTGMGKTTWACTAIKGKRLVLVPTVGALKSIEAKYDCAVFYEAKKNVTPNNEMIACTYSSFPNLFNIIQKWEGGVSEYTLIFDEQHNLAVSADKNYRNRELNFVLDNIHLFKKRLFMTGTMFPVEHPAIKDLKIHRVKWEQNTKKDATIVWVKDKYSAVEERLVKGKKNIIYLQDKQMHKQLGKLVSYLKSKNWKGIYLLNANEKDEPHFQNLVTSEYLEKDAEVIITTSVTVEAINILDLDVETVHFLTFENPRLMEQMVNRMRKKLPSKIFIYKKQITDVTEQSNNFELIDLQKTIVKSTEQLISFFAKPKQKLVDTYDLVSAQKMFSNQIFEKSSFFRVKNGLWDIDYLAIAYKIFNEETRYSKNNFEYFKMILAEYGWEFTEDHFDYSLIDDVEKGKFKEIQTAIKEEMNVYSLEIVESVQKKGLLELKKEIDSDKSIFDKNKFPDLDWDVRIKIIKLTKYMTFENACLFVFNLVSLHNNSDAVYDKAMRQVAVKIANISGALSSKINLDTPFSKAIMSFYFKGKKQDDAYTRKQLIQAFNKIRVINPTLANLTALEVETMAFEIFNKYFEINPVLIKGEVYFKLGGINVINEVSGFSTLLYDWIENCMQEGKSFSSKEIADVVNGIRKKFSLLGKIYLTPDQSVKLLQDFCTVKKTSKRVNGSVTSSYKIVDIEAEYIKGYEIIINQNILNTTETYGTNIERYVRTEQVPSGDLRPVGQLTKKHSNISSRRVR